jgi:Fe-S-cluster containining protein
MEPTILKPDFAARMADLYQRMEDAYDAVAGELGFTCQGCPDNCCDSFFPHHTYSEWAYLWEGLRRLPDDRLEEVRARAADYLDRLHHLLAKGESPVIMCPLNDEGLCSLYAHRLMICRMHGVPSLFQLPNGSRKEFQGCFRCQEQTKGRENLPTVDRTPLYRELAELERMLLTYCGQPMPRIKMTIAEMIIKGPPDL